MLESLDPHTAALSDGLLRHSTNPMRHTIIRWLEVDVYIQSQHATERVSVTGSVFSSAVFDHHRHHIYRFNGHSTYDTLRWSYPGIGNDFVGILPSTRRDEALARGSTRQRSRGVTTVMQPKYELLITTHVTLHHLVSIQSPGSRRQNRKTVTHGVDACK